MSVVDLLAVSLIANFSRFFSIEKNMFERNIPDKETSQLVWPYNVYVVPTRYGIARSRVEIVRTSVLVWSDTRDSSI